ncbi:SDR family NAD(P)-dependent oxidoreductase [Streptomyces sp. NPDC005925]|uniref:SDR family NAD(P)-dependent oxidoreductase n=1 Tax=Streptomyces sp. NPDC005925 TaxID=3157172 RepID=UPI003409BB72
MTASVLITGASSGIGRATARHLARREDLTVYATARRPETLEPAGPGIHPLALDVTDEESMRAAVKHIEERHGSVGALVNNAGYGQYGTVEETDMQAVRRQFETNVFGPARLAQLVLPGMRRAGGGRIVNIGSMGGRLVFPVGGYYHASKYAVEALSDALRFEAAPFGVKVSLVEPGLIRTGFEDTASGTLADSAGDDSVYAALNEAVGRRMADSYRSRLLAVGPDAVATVVKRAVTARRPRTRYVVTPAAVALVHTRRLLGGRAFDAYLRLQFGKV